MPSRRYAERTRVPVDQTRRDIETVLTKYGATGFIYGWQGAEAVIGFRMSDRHVKFYLPLPDGKTLGVDAANREARRRWRALLLVIKAKLEAVADGISIFDDEFLANIVTPDGTTMSEHLRPQIASMYKTGKMPPLLPHFKN